VSVEPIGVVTSVAAVLHQPNIDTDVIIRIDRMVSTEPSVLAPWAFEALRYNADGSENADFILNRAPFDTAQILLAGSNFGCGSSREPAVWAIKGLGIRVVIAPSFGDIFRANCHQNGLLPITLDDEDVRSLAAIALSGQALSVDLEARQIRAAGEHWAFAIGDSQRLALLQGLDDLDLALRESDRIDSWEMNDRVSRPWAWPSLPPSPEALPSEAIHRPVPERNP